MPPILHLVSRALPGHEPFVGEAGWRFWSRVRDAFPEALAACLMPNHLHLLVRSSPSRARQVFRGVASGFARGYGYRRLFEGVAHTEVRDDPKHLARQIRYIHLNPTRAGLVADPLAWPRSTHRGTCGGELDPWGPAERVRGALNWPESGASFVRRFHGYVSSDPSVHVEGTPSPQAQRVNVSRQCPDAPLEAVFRAAFAATPWSDRSVKLCAAVLLASSEGWTTLQIAAGLGISLRAVQRYARREDEPLLRVATTCLNDTRLRAEVDASMRRSRGPATGSTTRSAPWAEHQSVDASRR